MKVHIWPLPTHRNTVQVESTFSQHAHEDTKRSSSPCSAEKVLGEASTDLPLVPQQM